MPKVKFNLIVAACRNRGIGIKGDLPWHLRKELRHFSNTTKKKSDPSKTNVLIMGRKSYFGVPEDKRPLKDRLNIVLTRNKDKFDFPESVLVFSSLPSAIEYLEESEIANKIENVWIVGGSAVYDEAMKSEKCHRIYFTDIQGEFECDTFFPEIGNNFKLVPNDPEMPSEVQEEDGIKYQYKIYEKV
uniref:dihydrofolate reductase n=1 Tax=Culicoides sonorensis TaxID=179676 RepID=A0A336LYG9_CULSO